MKKYKHKYIAPLLISIVSAGCADSGGRAANALGAVDRGLVTVGQTAQTGRAVIDAGTAAATSTTATAVESAGHTGLTDALIGQLGVSQQQAVGGAGAIFQAAKANMAPQAFSNLSQSIPGMTDMLAAAPQISQPLPGVTSVLGSAGETVGTMTSLTSSFQQLNLSPNMVNQFIPVVVDYVKNTSGDVTANLLRSALIGP